MIRADVRPACAEGAFALPGASSWTPTGQAPVLLGTPHVRSFSYQGLTVSPNVYLAPMEGVTDSAFRRLCKRMAGGRLGMLVSEFVSVEGMTRFNPRTLVQTRFTEEELPFTVQIFGAEPSRMACAARMVEESGASAVEINVGCPVPRVVRKGGGSALLRDLPLLARICRDVRSAVRIPCSIKVRIGWSDELITLFETLRIAQDEGMGLLVVHGRTRAQGYKGFANWDLIGEVKARASIPVVGNGDIATWQAARDRLQRYGVDGILVGRGAIANPWIFGQVATAWEGCEPCDPSPADQSRAFHDYHDLLSEEMSHPGRILGKLKQFAARTLKAMRGIKEMRARLLRTESVEEFLNLSDAFFTEVEEGRRDALWDPAAVQNLNADASDQVVTGCQWV